MQENATASSEATYLCGTYKRSQVCSSLNFASLSLLETGENQNEILIFVVSVLDVSSLRFCSAQRSPFIEKKRNNFCLGWCSVPLNSNRSLIHDNFRWSKTPLGKLKARAVELENEARAEKEISEAKKKAAAGKN